MERQIVENMTTTSGSTSSHLSWEQERQASLSDAPAIPGRRPDATPNHSYCSAARPSNRLPIHMLALRKAKRKTKSHSSPSSRPITEMDVHPAVLFLSGTFSIATSIIVGPSLFPCQRDRRTMALDLLEQAIGIDLCVSTECPGYYWYLQRLTTYRHFSRSRHPDRRRYPLQR